MGTDNNEDLDIHGMLNPDDYKSAIDFVTGRTQQASLLSSQISAMTSHLFDQKSVSTYNPYSINQSEKLFPNACSVVNNDSFQKASLRDFLSSPFLTANSVGANSLESLLPKFNASDSIYTFPKTTSFPSLSSDLAITPASINPIEKYSATINASEYVPSLFETSRQASVSLSHLSTNQESINSIASIVTDNYKPWYEQTILKYSNSDYLKTQFKQSNIFETSNPLSKFTDAYTLSQFSVQSSLGIMTELSVFAERSIIGFDHNSIGSRINILDTTKNIISSSFLEVSHNYATLVKSFEINPNSYATLNPLFTKATSIECFTNANLIEAISCDEKKSEKEESIKNEIIIENQYSLTSFLPSLDKGLIKMWQGAIASLNSNNPDKVRHFCTSIRELFTQVMHILAPDKDVKKWSQKSDDIVNGKPTRRARLFYICRNISNGPFNKFVDKDISATLEFLGLFQEGTHAVTADFSENQLIALKVRAESSLRFIIEIGLKTNNY
jgi:hypothetical protein